MDVGWSRLSDLNVHEGKLLGCSYNQSCVGVWVVDISVFAHLALFAYSFACFLLYVNRLYYHADFLLLICN